MIDSIKEFSNNSGVVPIDLEDLIFTTKGSSDVLYTEKKFSLVKTENKLGYLLDQQYYPRKSFIKSSKRVLINIKGFSEEFDMVNIDAITDYFSSISDLEIIWGYAVDGSLKSNELIIQTYFAFNLNK